MKRRQRNEILETVARHYAIDAHKTPQTWQQLPDPHGEAMDQVVYGEGVWTVGSNGDYDDYRDAEGAAKALAWSWQGDLDNMLEDQTMTYADADTLLRDAALSIGLILEETQ